MALDSGVIGSSRRKGPVSMNFKRPLQLFRRFPVRTALSLTLSEGVRAVLDPHARIGYARSGEDRILSNYFDLSKPGFYVDVGCNHPFKGSLTLSLYSRGWQGLAVDGNPALVRLFQRCRPRDQCVHAVVSNEEKPVSFAIAKVPELSTLSADFEARRLGNGGVERRMETTSVRLDTLLSSAAVPRRFELLSIDVEEHDWEVLTSFDIEVYRPRVVAIEMHGYRPGATREDRVYRHLVEHGYGLRSFAVETGIFIDER
jgi:FkbM family methyltransferase